jgi:hypothetical protein
MINLSTPSKELLDELLSDYKKADYWLTKQLGGLKKQKELGDNLCLQCLKEGKELAVSEPVEYISPKGNRWMMYVSARRYKDHFYTTPLGFCYYETYGSIGAFVPTQCGSEDANACLIFTSHFFLRMCSRLNIKARSRDMVKRFVEYMAGMVVSYRGEGTHAKHEVDVRLPASIGRGHIREDSPLVIEITTFLKDSELTTKQKMETKALRECASKVILQPVEQLKMRAKFGDESVIDDLRTTFDAMNIDSSILDWAYTIQFTAKRIADRLALNFYPEKLETIMSTDVKNKQVIANALFEIVDKDNTEKGKANAFWEAVYWLLEKFNNNLDKGLIINESYKYIEDLENGSKD